MTTRTKTKKSIPFKTLWKRLFPARKQDEMRTDQESTPELMNFKCSACAGENEVPKIDDEDITEVDKDRVRTSCKVGVENLPEFPSRAEVKMKIEEAHKYYGVKCVYNRNGENGIGKCDNQPSWYYILERPLVEQYVLMNNYIRKLSVVASTEKKYCEDDDHSIEEEVSSISSSSDYSDFAVGSELVEAYRISKKNHSNDSSNAWSRMNTTTDKRISEVPLSTTEVSTITTKDYEIVIRNPTIRTSSTTNSASGTLRNEVSIAGGSGDEGFSTNQLAEMKKRDLSSGDHRFDDMSDFDLSYNLTQCPTTALPRPGQFYYRWRGNSCPTKTRGSFHNFFQSPEYMEMSGRTEGSPTNRDLTRNAFDLEPTPTLNGTIQDTRFQEIQQTIERNEINLVNTDEETNIPTSSDRNDDLINASVSQTMFSR